LKRISTKELFAFTFIFEDRSFFTSFLVSVGIKYDDFAQTYFYYDEDQNLHISESESGFIWISTYGLIARRKATDNSMLNSCVVQHYILSLIIEKAMEVVETKSVYDVDSYDFGQLTELTPALFQSIIFYIEVFCKAYLALNDVVPKRDHKLSRVYSDLKRTMYAKKHNDTHFQVRIVDYLWKIINYVGTIPGDFQEHFVKYDHNEEDSTIINFRTAHLIEMKNAFSLCNDFIMDFYYQKENSHYLKPGLLQRLLDKCNNEDEMRNVESTYGLLIRDSFK
jgi:hypothetical protein